MGTAFVNVINMWNVNVTIKNNTDYTIPLFIGCFNDGGTASGFAAGAYIYIEAIAIYNVILTPAQVTAITTRMAALP